MNPHCHRHVFILICWLASTLCGLAFQAPQRSPLPNLDQRAGAGAPAPAAAPAALAPAALVRLEARLPGVKVDRDPVLGAPKFISSTSGFLTGPNGEGRGVSADAARSVPANDPHRAVKAFLLDHAALFGHGPEALDAARVTRQFTNTSNGLRTTVWQQQLDGVDVFESVLLSHVTKHGELVNLSAQFVPDPAAAANAGAADRAGLLQNPAITAAQAVAVAARNVGELSDATGVSATGPAPAGGERKHLLKGPGVRGEATARLVWLPLQRAKMRLCWEVVFTAQTRGEMFRVLVDAGNSEVLVRHGLTSYISDASYRVWTSDSPSPFSPGHATPSTNQPPVVPRALVVTNAFNTNASPNGWIDDGVNETRGNNVDAHLDRNADNVADTPRPQGSPARVFDFPVDLTQSPTTATNASAAVVQLFYLCNMIHDRYYELGFTEAAGNFQGNNFGRGGAGNDAVQADAQDGAGFNNANFSTPPDGSSGRMQMFLFDGTTPDRDGDFDVEIVIHEYTHGLSNRRVGGGVGISALQSAGMGEGWSDWYGLCLLSEPGDDPGGNYAPGGYATYQFFGLTENYYYGIRRYPYSTNLSKNPLTFKDIDPNQASAHSGVPLSPIFGGGNAAEVHNQGEVWCVTLWEVRANLIAKHGHAVGNQLALQLVTDGMNLSPVNPNFLQSRDAILQADLVRTGGANRDELWRAFAKRGMGFSAISPPSTTTTGVRERFDVPDDLRVTPVDDLMFSGAAAGPFLPSSTNLTLANVGTNPVPWTVSSLGLVQLSATSGSLPVGGPSATVTVTVRDGLKNLPPGTYTDTLTFSNGVSHAAQTRTVIIRVGGADYFTEIFEANDLVLSFQTVTLAPDGSEVFYRACRESAGAFPTDPAGGTVVPLTDDTSIRVELAGGAEVSLYGQRTNTFFIGSNGYLTLEAGDSTFFTSPASHFRLPRVAALFRDLDPGAGGIVSWKQLPDRVAVTFQNVPRYAFTDQNSFQIELFFDGRIRLTWLQLAAMDGIVGLSAGAGVPVDFQESRFLSYGTCASTLRVSVPIRANENSGEIVGAGRVTVPVPQAADVLISLSSSDPALVDLSPGVFLLAGETNAFFDLLLNDDTLLNGTRQVRIAASGPGLGVDSRLILVDDNETTTLTLVLPASAREGDGVLAGAGRLTLGDAPDHDVVVRFNSPTPNELTAASPGLIIPAGESGVLFDLRVVDDTNLDGEQPGTLVAHVQNWSSGSATMTVLDNEAASFTLGTPLSVSEGSGTLTNAGFIVLAGTALTNLVVELSSLDPSEILVPSNVTILAGTTFSFFNVTAVNDPDLDGTQAAPVVASAPGFPSRTNIVNVSDDEAPVAPANPSPRNFSNNVPLQVTLSWRSGEGEQVVNGGFETGDLTGWAQENFGSGSFVADAGTFDPESPEGPSEPFSGTFSALTQQQGPGRHALYQDIVIPSGATFAHLSWADWVRNFAPDFGPGQEFRVELRTTLNQVLAVPFRTQPGDAAAVDWVPRNLDLSAYRGRTVRLAFVAEDSVDYLNVRLDQVSLVLGAPLPTTFDVYFGTNPVPAAPEFLGTTTNAFWSLPPLAQYTTYYWQVLAGRGSLLATGPVWRFRTLASPTIETLVRAGSVWKYFDRGMDLGTAWRETNFNDSAWSAGTARLGYGGDGEVTTISYGPNANSKYTTTYFRRSFAVTNAASFVDLAGRLSRDDGAVVYLNGQEVFRSNLPQEPAVITYDTFANFTINTPDETVFLPFTLNPALLLEGTNVLGVEVHQATPDSTDLGFDLDLTGTSIFGSNQPPLIALTNPAVNYAIISTPTNFLIAAAASDSDGTIAKVEFFVDDVRLFVDTFAPYGVLWLSPVPGTHALRAVATDNHGASNVTAVVYVVVNRAGNPLFTLAPTNAVWKYLDQGSDQGTAWRGTNFDDSAWFSGPAELGYGDGDEATPIGFGPDPNNRYVTTYFRYAFTNEAVFSSASLSLVRDDGAVVYLNGTEVFRSNMPGGVINYLSLASATVNAPQESQFYNAGVNPVLVRRGRNVLAAEVHQADVTSTDLSFKLEFTGTGNFPPQVALTAPAPDTVLLAPSSVPLLATAADRYGRVARVEFFADAARLATDTNAPFSFDWHPLPGTYALTAIATDSTGGSNRSAVVNITILPPPTLLGVRAGAALNLSWPATAGDFALQSAPSLNEPIPWSPVTNPPVLTEERLEVVLDPSATNQFFRLARP